MREFKTIQELVEWIEAMQLQNTSGRETNREMFTLGIRLALEELIDMKILKTPVNGKITL